MRRKGPKKAKFNLTWSSSSLSFTFNGMRIKLVDQSPGLTAASPKLLDRH
jgi:hypothetical protein